jgi:molybdopterin/thiamine biosynthesis adenylyltransferase
MQTSNRHDGNLDGKLTRPDQLVTVTVRTSLQFADTVAGQHLLWMLINLLARQYDVVGCIRVAVPTANPHKIAIPLCAQGDLTSSLVALGQALAQDKIDIETVDVPSNEVDAVEVLIEGIDHRGSWGAYADGWRVALGPAGSIASHIPTSETAIGPYFAAALLAGEVFKSARGLSEERRRFEPLFFSTWNFQAAPTFSELEDGPASALDIPLAYLVGAGAVIQAFAATLRGCASVTGRFVVADHDSIDDELTNLNRYCLALPSDAGANKATLLARLLPAERFQVHAVPKRWEEYISDTSHPWPNVRAAEHDGRFDMVISGVDINQARHAIQRMWPRLIYGGSTLDLSVTIERYDLGRTDDECLMCSNPIEAWTIEQQTNALQTMSADERRYLATRVGADVELVEAHVQNPKCGTVAEAEMHKFRSAATSAVQWSVGFVSVGAGVLLAARLLHDLMVPTGAENASRFNFESNKSRQSFHRPNPECQCITSGRKLHERLWS